MIGEIISHYRIIEKLGEGGMGEVYKAEDTVLKRTVALKFLPPSVSNDESARKRFTHEAVAASALDHPNICTIYETGQTEDGRLYISMAYYDGETLKDKIMRGPLEIDESLSIFLQVCEGLEKAHKNGIIHRDIKPTNIFIKTDGLVKILDFGLAKVKGQTRLTQTESTAGTVNYMSPEQARGEEVDQKTDIWSLGIVLYEMLTGTLPFNSEFDQAVIYSILNEDPDLSKIPAVLISIIKKTINKNLNERYQKIEELTDDIYYLQNKSLKKIRRSIVKLHGRLKLKTKTIFILALIFISALTVIFYLYKGNNAHNVKAAQESTYQTPRKSLAVMYFDNIPDPKDKDHTGEMLTNLLITSLSQVKEIDVISRERLLDIQRNLGRFETKSLSPSYAEKVAHQANVNTMLIGSIIQEKPNLAVTAWLIDVETGRIINSHKVTKYHDSNIFVLVDSLAYLLRTDFRIASASKSEVRPVSEVTTNSPEAYRAYIEGINLFNKNYLNEAGAAFERAIEIDSNFAMAYNWLSYLTANPRKNWELFQKAVSLVDKTTERERLYILATNYFLYDDQKKAEKMLENIINRYPHEIRAYELLGRVYGQMLSTQKAAEVFKLGLKINPSAKRLLNDLSYNYLFLNQKQKALNTVNDYIKLAPAEPNPYDTKGDIYSFYMQYDSSHAAFQKSFELRNDYSTEKLGFQAVARGKYDEAERYFEISRYKNPVIEIHKGKMLKAIEKLNVILISHKDSISILYKLLPLYYEVGQYPEMLHIAKELSKNLKKYPPEKFYGRQYIAWALVKNGKQEEADKMMKELKRNAVNSSPRQQIIIKYSSAVISFEKGDYNSASRKFAEVFAEIPPKHWPSIFFAVALLKTGKVADAINIFQQITNWPPDYGLELFWAIPESFESWPIPTVKAHYWLGVAYEKEGNKNKAIKEYETFLKIWKDADFNSPEIKDAKARIQMLKRIAIKD